MLLNFRVDPEVLARHLPAPFTPKLHGVVLRTRSWLVEPLDVRTVRSSFFSDEARFPPGSVAFDHGLLMRNIEHEWHGAPDLVVERPAALS